MVVQSSGRLKRVFTLLVIMSLFVLTQWSSSLYIPVLPSVAQYFSEHRQLIVSSLSLSLVGFALGQLFWGMISDHWDRHLTLLLALIGLSAVTAVVLLPVGAIWFVILLALMGFFVAASTSIGHAIIRETYQEKAKNIIGYVGIAMAFAPAIAPIISAQLFYAAGWKAIFVFLSLLSMVIVFSCSAIFRSRMIANHKEESNSIDREETSTQSFWAIIRETLTDKSFSWFCTTLTISFGAFFSLLLVLPLLMSDIGGHDVKTISNTMFMVTLACSFGACTNAWLTRKISLVAIVKIGLSCMALGAVVFITHTLFFTSSLLSSTNAIAVAICMYGVATVIPASKAGAMMSREKHLGTAASIMKFTQTLGGVLFTQLVSVFEHHNTLIDFLYLQVIIILLIWVGSLIPVSLILNRLFPKPSP